MDMEEGSGLSCQSNGGQITFVVTFKAATAAQGTTPATPREFIRISLPRFRGGTATGWLQWLPQFERIV
uniref:Uncharacterized protein n=1 Tax=Peronospora matthiolae TaxID=2874970 RepID=A0AAV1TH09_9STRA